MAGVEEPLPLSALLSHAFVAFTIELDNAWEVRILHRTTSYVGVRGAPFACSLRQWANFMSVLGEKGLTVSELERSTRAPAQLDLMRRGRYVVIRADPKNPRAKRVIPTAGGRRAQEVWRSLPDEIDGRWRDRFGVQEVGGQSRAR